MHVQSESSRHSHPVNTVRCPGNNIAMSTGTAPKPASRVGAKRKAVQQCYSQKHSEPAYRQSAHAFEECTSNEQIIQSSMHVPPASCRNCEPLNTVRCPGNNIAINTGTAPKPALRVSAKRKAVQQCYLQKPSEPAYRQSAHTFEQCASNKPSMESSIHVPTASSRCTVAIH